MLRRFSYLALSVGVMLSAACVERPNAPDTNATANVARHAPVSLRATLQVTFDADLNGRHWMDEKGIHGRQVPAELFLTGEAAGAFTGIGSCTIDFDFEPEHGNGSFRTTDEYDVSWGVYEGCFVGRTEWSVRNFEVSGQVTHRGTGECNGMEIRGSFAGRWGQPAFEMRGTIAL